VRFQAVTAVLLEIQVFFDVTPYQFVNFLFSMVLIFSRLHFPKIMFKINFTIGYYTFIYFFFFHWIKYEVCLYDFVT
jgi:hypothetical protein